MSTRTPDGCRPTQPLRRCSFCGKSQATAPRIICGPCVYICNECVQLCCEILEEEEAAKRAAIANGPDLDDDATLGALLLGLPWEGEPMDLRRLLAHIAERRQHTYAEAIIRAAIAALEG